MAEHEQRRRHFKAMMAESVECRFVLLQPKAHIIFSESSSSSLSIAFGLFCHFCCSQETARTFCQTFFSTRCMCRCKKLFRNIFIRKLEYWTSNFYFLICFLFQDSSLSCASSVGEFEFRFNVNFKLFLYFNSDLFYLLPNLSSRFSFDSFFWLKPQKCRIQIGIDRLYRCKAFGNWLSLYCEFVSIRFSVFDSLESRFLWLRFSFNYLFDSGKFDQLWDFWKHKTQLKEEVAAIYLWVALMNL